MPAIRDGLAGAGADNSAALSEIIQCLAGIQSSAVGDRLSAVRCSCAQVLQVASAPMPRAASGEVDAPCVQPSRLFSPRAPASPGCGGEYISHPPTPNLPPLHAHSALTLRTADCAPQRSHSLKRSSALIDQDDPISTLTEPCRATLPLRSIPAPRSPLWGWVSRRWHGEWARGYRGRAGRGGAGRGRAARSRAAAQPTVPSPGAWRALN
jgi:hypothetical protein